MLFIYVNYIYIYKGVHVIPAEDSLASFQQRGRARPAELNRTVPVSPGASSEKDSTSRRSSCDPANIGGKHPITLWLCQNSY